MGLIRPVVGPRGSGKTAHIYSLVSALAREKGILPVYVSVGNSLKHIRRAPQPTSVTVSYVQRDILRSIIKAMQKTRPGFVDKNPVVDSIWQRVTDKAEEGVDEESVPMVRDSDLRVLLQEIHSEGLRIVIAIDELDKLSSRSEVATVKEFFRSEQFHLTDITSNWRTSIYLSSSETWDFLKEQDFNYLSSTVQVIPISKEEARKIIQKRIDILSPGCELPISDDALACLVSVWRGNIRNLIYECEKVLDSAHNRGLKRADKNLVLERCCCENGWSGC
jgi:Cdc6-like AAA superfamily ATPase